MRVLSLHQPFAQLVVRGVKRVEVRSWTTEHRGRIAIHAKAVAPSHEIERTWRADRDLALRLADEGWLDREDLKKLPRSAIVGTVYLNGVARGSDQQKDAEDASGLLAWNPVTRWFELAVRDRRTNRLRPRHSSMRPLPTTFRPNDYLWVFGDAVEIEPLDVTGKQNLWHLDEALSERVAWREARSLSGEWERPPVNRKRRDESIRVWRERYLSDLEREVIKVEERVRRERDRATLHFPPSFEFRLRGLLGRYEQEQGVIWTDDQKHVTLDRRLRPLFQGRDLMPVDELELELRRYIKAEVARQAAADRERARRKLLMQMMVELKEDPEQLRDEKVTLEEKLARSLHAMLDEEEGVKRVPEPPPRRRTPAKGEQPLDDPRGELDELLETLGLSDTVPGTNWNHLRRPPGRRKETADPEDDA